MESLFKEIFLPFLSNSHFKNYVQEIRDLYLQDCSQKFYAASLARCPVKLSMEVCALILGCLWNFRLERQGLCFQSLRFEAWTLTLVPLVLLPTNHVAKVVDLISFPPRLSLSLLKSFLDSSCRTILYSHLLARLFG